jgi:hypothetical protein
VIEEAEKINRPAMGPHPPATARQPPPLARRLQNRKQEAERRGSGDAMQEDPQWFFRFCDALEVVARLFRSRR